MYREHKSFVIFGTILLVEIEMNVSIFFKLGNCYFAWSRGYIFSLEENDPVLVRAGQAVRRTLWFALGGDGAVTGGIRACFAWSLRGVSLD